MTLAFVDKAVVVVADDDDDDEEQDKWFDAK